MIPLAGAWGGARYPSMTELPPRPHLRAAPLAALLVASLVGCSADGAYYGSPCDSPIAATYTAYCNPYLERGGRG